MDFKTLFLALLAGILVNNYVFERFLGVTPFLGYAKFGKKTAAVGLALTVTLVLSAAVIWPVNVYVLTPLKLGYLQLLVYVALILLILYLVQLVCGKKFGVYFPLLALNAALLGGGLLASESYAESLVAALGVGLGFLLGMPMFAALIDRLEEVYIPRAFRGLPIRLLTASIISMALLAFK